MKSLSLHSASVGDILSHEGPLCPRHKINSMASFASWSRVFPNQLDGFTALKSAFYAYDSKDGLPSTMTRFRAELKNGTKVVETREKFYLIACNIPKSMIESDGVNEGHPSTASAYDRFLVAVNKILGAIVYKQCIPLFQQALANHHPSLKLDAHGALAHFRSLASPSSSAHARVLASQQRLKTLKQQPQESFQSFSIKCSVALNEHIDLTSRIPNSRFDDPSILASCMMDNLHDAAHIMEAKRYFDKHASEHEGVFPDAASILDHLTSLSSRGILTSSGPVHPHRELHVAATANLRRGNQHYNDRSPSPQRRPRPRRDHSRERRTSPRRSSRRDRAREISPRRGRGGRNGDRKQQQRGRRPVNDDHARALAEQEDLGSSITVDMPGLSVKQHPCPSRTRFLRYESDKKKADDPDDMHYTRHWQAGRGVRLYIDKLTRLNDPKARKMATILLKFKQNEFSPCCDPNCPSSLGQGRHVSDVTFGFKSLFCPTRVFGLDHKPTDEELYDLARSMPDDIATLSARSSRRRRSPPPSRRRQPPRNDRHSARHAEAQAELEDVHMQEELIPDSPNFEAHAAVAFHAGSSLALAPLPLSHPLICTPCATLSKSALSRNAAMLLEEEAEVELSTPPPSPSGSEPEHCSDNDQDHKIGMTTLSNDSSGESYVQSDDPLSEDMSCPSSPSLCTPPCVSPSTESKVVVPSTPSPTAQATQKRDPRAPQLTPCEEALAVSPGLSPSDPHYKELARFKTCLAMQVNHVTNTEATRMEICSINVDHLLNSWLPEPCSLDYPPTRDHQIIDFMIKYLSNEADLGNLDYIFNYICDSKSTVHRFTQDGIKIGFIGSTPFGSPTCAKILFAASDMLNGEIDFHPCFMSQHTYPFLLFSFDTPDEDVTGSNMGMRSGGILYEELCVAHHPLRRARSFDVETMILHTLADLAIDAKFKNNVSLSLNSRVRRAINDLDCQDLIAEAKATVLSCSSLTDFIQSVAESKTSPITEAQATRAMTCLYIATCYERCHARHPHWAELAYQKFHYPHCSRKSNPYVFAEVMLSANYHCAHTNWTMPASTPPLGTFPSLCASPFFHMCLDSGASHNYVNDISLLAFPFPVHLVIHSSKKGATMVATHKGKLATRDSCDLDAYYVPDLGPNLLSLAQLIKNKYIVCLKSMSIIKDDSLFTTVSFMHASNMFRISLPRLPAKPSPKPCSQPWGICVSSDEPDSAIPVSRDDAPPSIGHKSQPHGPQAHSLSYAEHNKAMLYHCRFNHCSVRLLKTLNNKLSLGIPLSHFKTMGFCSACALSKTKRKPAWRKVNRGRLVNASLNAPIPSVTYKPLECFSMDLFGPVVPLSPERYSYGAVSVDKVTGLLVFFPLKAKSDVLLALKNLREVHIAPHGRRLMSLKTDNAPELKRGAFGHYCRMHGIRRLFATPGVHSDQGRAEKAIHDVVTMARTLLACMNAPSNQWVHACHAAVHVHGLLPRNLRPSPMEMTHGYQPSTSHVRVFWSPVFVYQRPNERFKSHRFKPVTLPGRFCGYTISATQYKVMVNSRLYHRRTVIFNEDTALVHLRPMEDLSSLVPNLNSLEAAAPAAPLVPQSDSRFDPNVSSDHPHFILDAPHGDPIQDAEITLLSAPTPTAQETLRALTEASPIRFQPQRSRAPVDYGPMISSVALAQLAFSLSSREAASIPTPKTANEALTGPNRHEWKLSMDREVASLRKFDAFEFAPLPKGRKAIKMKWVFKVKQNENGELIKLKSRLTGCGYAQRWGVDYLEVTAPVASYTVIRMLLAFAALHDWELEQMDVDTAFLNSDLDVPIYCIPPPFLRAPPNMFILLKAALYGLKQGSRCFNILLHKFLVNTCGFTQSKNDPCLYMLRKPQRTVLIAIFVDDVVIAAPDKLSVKWIKDKFCSRFSMSDQGPLKWILGMHVARNRESRTLSLDQSRYITDFLKKYGMDACNPVLSPSDVKVTLTKPDSPLTPEDEAQVSRHPFKFSSCIGSTLYAALSSRFDVCYPVNVAARHTAWPGPSHFTAVKRVLRYLKGTHTYSVLYGSSPLNDHKVQPTLFAYSDSDWAACKDTRSSTSCHMVYFCGGPIQAVTRRLKCIALSSTDAEYYALSDTARELSHIRRMASDIIGSPLPGPTPIFVDNQAAINIATSETCSRRSKHIEIRFHHVREMIKKRVVKPYKIDTKYNMADIGTKSLPAPRFLFLRDRLMSKFNASKPWLRPMTSEERAFYDSVFKINGHF